MMPDNDLSDKIVQHWPDLITGAYVSVIYCYCTTRLEAANTDAVVDLWAAHVADQLNNWNK